MLGAPTSTVMFLRARRRDPYLIPARAQTLALERDSRGRHR